MVARLFFCKQNRVCNTGNGLPLLDAQRGHQRTRADKEHSLQFTFFDFSAKQRADQCRRASTARCPGMHILFFYIKQKISAILMHGTDIKPLMKQDLTQQL